MGRSTSTVSDYLGQLEAWNDDIQNSLLIGEQVSMINDAAVLYNGLRSLITPSYLLDEEFAWLKSIADEWNVITRTYNKQMQGTATESMQDNLDHLQDMIQDLLDDLHRDED
tara:strand:- start:389 stop:724 length:336 start_codon:yes stop_codon:yes gene_type:complete